MRYLLSWRDLAKWLECLAVNASHNSPGFDPIILQHSGIWGAADEAVLNNVHKNKKSKKSLFYLFLYWFYSTLDHFG